MKVIILSAGVGSRLRPVTDLKPKCLVTVCGIPILHHQIQTMKDCSVEESSIYIVGGYCANMISGYLSKNFPETKPIVNEKYETTNNMYSLWTGLEKIKFEKDDDLIIMNGDCVYDKEILNDIIKQKNGNYISYDKGSYRVESMKITTEAGRVLEISKKISKEKASGNSIDLYRMEQEVVKTLHNQIKTSYLEKGEVMKWNEYAINDLLPKYHFNALNVRGRRWSEIDDFDDLKEAQIKFSTLDMDAKKCIISDLDGTVYIGDRQIENAVNWIRAQKEKRQIFFLSNNTSKTPVEYVKKLESFLIETDENRVITPLRAALKEISQRTNGKIMLLANKKVERYIRNVLPNAEFSSKWDECGTLFLCYDDEMTYEKLKNAALLLQNKKNVRYIATHSDMICPTENGFIPDIGSLIKILEIVSQRVPDMVFGKPNPKLVEEILKKYSKEEILLIGDRLYTDFALAKNIGCDFVCVLSGETTLESIESGKQPIPNLYLDDMGELKRFE